MSFIVDLNQKYPCWPALSLLSYMFSCKFIPNLFTFVLSSSRFSADRHGLFKTVYAASAHVRQGKC